MPALESDAMRDREALPLRRVSACPARGSAVSQTLRAIRDGAADGGAVYRFRAAGDAASREKAWRLAYELYRAKGYVPENPRRRIADANDARPDTFTLLAEDAAGNAAATGTLVFDGAEGLPCDAVFREELAALRTAAGGVRIAEVTRLAIAEAHARDRMLLVRLFNLIYIYARRAMGCTDFVVEVHPRHAGFYRRFLRFGTVAQPRPCERVGGAPAVLLHLRFEAVAHAFVRPDDPAYARTLYPCFIPVHREASVARQLRAEHRPLGESEAAQLAIPSFCCPPQTTCSP